MSVNPTPTADDHVARSIAYGQFVGAAAACKRDLGSAYVAATELSHAAIRTTLAAADPADIEALARTARAVANLLDAALSRLDRAQVAA
ncbi:hypothetical protein [uncultured Methylobacterium sp.]|uniref:hypothetical protein n=1 Tax=uncultured Methylobacterium sp. TaxID=157278 RepID=UPI0035CC4E76